MNVVPYSFDSDVQYMPSIQMQSAPGQAQGVYIVLHPDTIDEIEDKMQQWFEGRPQIQIVDVGTSDKQGLGFIILEWMECAVDPLFLAFLRTEAWAGDYTTYIRNLNNLNNEGI
ncbi:MAG: hypothetical protein H0V70_24165 [Ktedonobacteraceae bacterium]|nr:hypothetical protein [Ktedonobacteraceae bacterium]